jgi:molecular chaperone DnaK (HSP70)
MSKVQLGIDFGSYQFRAAYVQDGHVVSIPLSPDDIEKRTNVMVCYLPPRRLDTMAQFGTLKQEITSGRMLQFYQSLYGHSDHLTPKGHVQRSLNSIREFSRDYIGEEISQVTIAVPSTYTEQRRAALREASQQAGFREVTLINDCTAATIGHLHTTGESHTVLVYSSGYLGLEVSLLRVVKQHYREIIHDSLPHPSGQYIDALIMRAVLDDCLAKGAPIPWTRWGFGEWFEFQDFVETLKKQLSIMPVVKAALSSNLYLEPVDLTYTVQWFEQQLQPSVEASQELIQRVLDEADMSIEDIDVILFNGGTTRIDYIQRQIGQRFGKQPVLTEISLIAAGAAVYASRLGATPSKARQPTVVGTNTQLQKVEAQPPTAAQVEMARVTPAAPPDVMPILAYLNDLVAQGNAEVAQQFAQQLSQQMSTILQATFKPQPERAAE